MTRIELIIEKSEGLLWGRVEDKKWMPSPYGKTLPELIDNLKELVADYATHEGKNDKDWNKIDWDKMKFSFKYDLTAFFEVFDFLNLSAIAVKAHINRTLLNHYKTGLKHPSAQQAKKIEDAIHLLAKELGAVKLVA